MQIQLLGTLTNRLQVPLKSRTAGKVWILAFVATLVLAWQQISGWPFTQRIAVQVPTGEKLQAVRLPVTYPENDWNNAMVRVTERGRALPHYVNKEALEEGGKPGYSVKGRYVQLRGSLEDANSRSEEKWIIEVPRVLNLSSAVAYFAVFLGFTILLLYLRNPVVMGACKKLLELSSGRCAHLSLWSLVVLAAAVAVGLRIWGFSFPNWANDTPTYFDSVFAVAEGERPMATPDRPFVYPIVMGNILRLVPDLRAIVTAQAVASLCAAFAIGAVIWLASIRLWKHPFSRLIGRILAVVTGAAFALDETIIEREWSLLSEAWAALFLGFQAILAWLLVSRQRTLGRSLVLYGLFCVSGMLTFFTRANWGFALALLPLPWVVVAILHNTSFLGVVRWGIPGALVLMLTSSVAFAYQAHCTSQKPSVSLYYRARALVCWHVPLVRLEIDRRISTQPEEAYRPILIEMAQVMDRELAQSKITGAGAYPSLGYDADRLFFVGLPSAPHFQTLSIEKRTKLCTDLFVQALKRNPGVYGAKVLAQMRLLFTKLYKSPKVPVRLISEALEKSRTAAETSTIIPPHIARAYRATLEKAQAEFATPWPSAGRLALSARACVIFEFLRSTFALVLSVSMAVITMAITVPSARRAIRWRMFVAPLCVAIWATGSVVLSALSSAVTQGLDVQRYVELSMPLALLSQILWPLLACTIAGELVQAYRVQAPRTASNEFEAAAELQSEVIDGARC